MSISYILFLIKVFLGKIRRRLTFRWQFKGSLRTKGLLLIVLPFLLQLYFFATLIHMQDEADRAAKQEYNSRMMFSGVNWLSAVLLCANLSSLAHYLAGWKDCASLYALTHPAADKQLDELKGLFVGDARGLVNLQRLHSLSQTLFQKLDVIANMQYSPENLVQVKQLGLSPLWGKLAWARHDLLFFGRDKFKITAESISSTRERNKRIALIGFGLDIIALIIAIYFFGTGITERLEVLADNSVRLAENKALNPPIGGSDEISLLDKSFHAMADALNRAREKERAVLDNMLVGLITIDPRGIMESSNPSISQMFGYSQADLTGNNLMILFPDVLHAPNFMETISQQALGKIAEIDAKRAGGEIFPIELSVTQFETDEGTRYLANILDVSERREIEKLKRAFVATVSHELRTPLTSIRGSLTLLNSGAVIQLSGQAKQLVTIAERNTLRLISLINDILDIEKLEAGKLEMQFAAVPLATIIERSFEAVKAFGDQHSVTIQADPASEILFADEQRIIQVLVNLLSNAIKFSPKGETVSVKHWQNNGFVEVHVVDKGRGIPEKYKNLLFERFQQVPDKDAKNKGGTGLGLAICKQIIEQHGGSIGVNSEENKGSTFWFKLPAAK